jgi:hypothetical protein
MHDATAVQQDFDQRDKSDHCAVKVGNSYFSYTSTTGWHTMPRQFQLPEDLRTVHYQ